MKLRLYLWDTQVSCFKLERVIASGGIRVTFPGGPAGLAQAPEQRGVYWAPPGSPAQGPAEGKGLGPCQNPRSLQRPGP